MCGEARIGRDDGRQGFRFWDALAKDPSGFRFSLDSLDMKKMNEVENRSLFKKGILVDVPDGAEPPEYCP